MGHRGKTRRGLHWSGSRCLRLLIRSQRISQILKPDLLDNGPSTHFHSLLGSRFTPGGLGEPMMLFAVPRLIATRDLAARTRQLMFIAAFSL